MVSIDVKPGALKQINGADMGFIDTVSGRLYSMRPAAGQKGKIVEVSGASPLTLTNALAAPIESLVIYGWCKQDGTPTPEAPVDITSAGDSGSITLTLSQVGGVVDKEVVLKLSAPLYGVQTTSIGTWNHKDSEGRYWACDTIEWTKTGGKIVRRFERRDITADNVTSLEKYNHIAGYSSFRVSAGWIYERSLGDNLNILCTHMQAVQSIWGNGNDLISIWASRLSASDNHSIMEFNIPNSVIGVEDTATADDRLAAFKAWVADKEFYYVAKLYEPKEEPLTAEQLAALKNLQAPAGDVQFANDVSCEMKVQYRQSES